MIPWIILSVIVLIIIFKSFLPQWVMMRRMEEISWIFEKSFDIYPEERERIFCRNYRQEIICGKTRFSFYDIKEACSEFEKCINNLINYYEKYNWIVERDPDLQFNKEQLSQIANKVRWLSAR